MWSDRLHGDRPVLKAPAVIEKADIMRPGERPSIGIAVMAKASAPGWTKTRLVPPLSLVEAAALNTSFLQDIAANLLTVARPALTSYVAFGPPDAESFFRAILPPGTGLIESWIGPLGDCLLHAVSELFARGHTAACVLNSDSPTLPTSILVDLVDRLSAPGDYAVLGPCEDGGYYALGVKFPHRRLFEDITWSTDQVAAQTLERAREIGLPVHLLPVWYDVDEACFLRRLKAELCDEVLSEHVLGSFAAPHRPYAATHTRAVLARLLPAQSVGEHNDANERSRRVIA